MDSAPNPKRSSGRSHKEDLYEHAAKIASDTLKDQLAELDSIRSRAMQYLAFVGASTAFLAGTALRGAGSNTTSEWYNISGILASLGFLALLLLARAIVTGTEHWWGFGKPMDWHGRQDATAYVEWLDETSPSRVTFYRYLTQLYSRQANKNLEYLRLARQRYIGLLTVGALTLLVWGALAWVYGV